jgi:hypothetical protein
LDTVRFLYRLHDDRQKRRAEQELRRPTKLAPRLTEQSPDIALHFGYSPDREQIWVEGRPATIVFPSVHDDRRLLPPSRIEDASELIAIALEEQGYTPFPIRPSRLDHTATVAFDRPSEGWAFLYGMYALSAPRRKPALYGRPVETVYWLKEQSGEKVEKAYDKGYELGNAPRGLEVRLEARVRPEKEQRTAAEWWTPERVKGTFMQRFAAMAKSADGVRVGDQSYVAEQLRDFALEGRITIGTAKALMGHLVAESVGLPQKRRTWYYNRAQLRRLGLAMALDGADDGQVLDLGAVLEDALTSPRWSE